jgi:LacI family transcriptional regulator
MTEKRVTLADIARAAGVHTTTVSMALRNHPRLPEATRVRLQALAKQMNYAPDPWVRALVAYRGAVRVRRSPATIAYVTNWNTRWGWKRVTAHPEFYAGAEARAKELGYQLEHFWLREPGLTHGRLSGILQNRGINGVIIASHERKIDEALQFDWEHISGIKIDYFPHRPALHNVTNNQCNIIRLAMRHVMEAGYRRIGFVMHRGWDHSVDHFWSAGYLCEQQNIAPEDRVPMFQFPDPEPADDWINEGKSDAVASRDALARWLEKHRPEVVISKASFVLPVLEQLGVRVPDDLAFVDVFLEDTTGAMAGVRQNHAAVGALAVEMLASRLQHNDRGAPEIPTTTYVDGTWFDGRTLPVRTGAIAR